VKILITGGAGFIGRHLSRLLVRETGAEIRVLDNLQRGCADDLPPEVRLIAGDIRDRETLRRAIVGVDTVYHLAAQANVIGASQDIDYSFSTNVAGSFEVFRAAAEAQVRRVVFSSSREVYGEAAAVPVHESAPMDPKNAYGVSKAAAEMYARLFNLQGTPIAVLRLANVYGPGDRNRVVPLFFENALSGRPLVLYGGGQTLDFVSIDTVTRALQRAATDESVTGPVNVGSGYGTTIRGLAERILELTASASEIIARPSRSVETQHFIADIRTARARWGLSDGDAPLAGLPSLLETYRRNGCVPDVASRSRLS
jgi:UDP-glucose 4-epimerase